MGIFGFWRSDFYLSISISLAELPLEEDVPFAAVLFGFVSCFFSSSSLTWLFLLLLLLLLTNGLLPVFCRFSCFFLIEIFTFRAGEGVFSSYTSSSSSASSWSGSSSSSYSLFIYLFIYSLRIILITTLLIWMIIYN